MMSSCERVLNDEAVKILQSHNLLSERTDDIARWTIKPLPFPTSFPYLKFDDGKIPWAYNMPIFLVYLGFENSVAFTLYQKLAEKTPPTRVNLMECVKDHVNLKWSTAGYNGPWITTYGGQAVLNDMGLTTPFFRDEILNLKEAYRRDKGVLRRFFSENPDKNIDNYVVLDLILEVLRQRMLKLMDLNQAVLENLEEISGGEIV